MRKIKFKEIRKQLVRDLIGKDSFRGVSLTYSWLANQWGHFSLGFIPTHIVNHWVEDSRKFENPILVSMLIIGGIWTLFELYNFIMPIIKKRTSKSNLIYLPDKKRHFTPPWANVAFDTATDLSYFYLGILCAGYHSAHSSILLACIIGIIILMIYPSYYWYSTKMFLQAAKYPMQKRLSQWEGNISTSNKTSIDDFVLEKCEGKHYLIFGDNIDEISQLSIGMLTEKSNKHFSCCYLTAIKLYQAIVVEEKEDNNELWTWRNSEYLMIDDINPSKNVKEDFISPEEFKSILLGKTKENAELIKNKNILWVLGSSNREIDRLDAWHTMLNTIGVKNSNIITLDLK